MNNKTEKGFTLIELMIVVAIIGILASIALPAFQTYVAKTKIASIVVTFAAGKTPIFDFAIDNGRMPTDADFTNDSGLSGFKKLIDGDLAGGDNTTYTFSAQDTFTGFLIRLGGINGNVNGKTILILYRDDGEVLKMECNGMGLANKYLPKQCQN